MADNREPDAEEIEKYQKDFSDEGLWDKVTSHVQAIGTGLIYKALQLYYAAQNPACPATVKYSIYAALGYLISPLDLIPDFTPVAGYADDASAVAAALVWAQMYIDDTVKGKAKEKIQSLFGADMLCKLDA